MKTRNKKGSGMSAAEEEVGLKTPVKNAEAVDMKSVGVLTRSQKKRLSEVGTRTPHSKALKESHQSTVRKKRSSDTGLEKTENEEQNLDVDPKCSNKSIPSKRRSTRIQQTIQHEMEDKQSKSHKREDSNKNKLDHFSENINDDNKRIKRELFHNIKEIYDKVSSVETSESESSKSKHLSDVEEFEAEESEISEIIADGKDLHKNVSDQYKCNKSGNVEKKIENFNESIGDKQNKPHIKNEGSVENQGSEGSSPRKKPRTSNVENVQPNTTKKIEDSMLVKNKYSDSDDGSVVVSSQITDTSDATKGSENCEFISQKTPKLFVKLIDINPSKSTEKRKGESSLQEKTPPLNSEDKNDSQREINKNNSPLKTQTTDISFKSSSVTENGSSEGSSLTDDSEIKTSSTKLSNMPFKEPKFKVSKSSVDTTAQFTNKKSKISNESIGSINNVVCAKKESNTFGRYEMKSPILSSTFEKRKSISSKEDVNETSDSDSDAESRKAIMESAQKRIIQNISTSESESRKTVLPVKTLKKLKISSDSDSAPESLGFNVARQQAKDSLKHAVESIQREKKRRKEKRKLRLEKYKQQKEEKLIRLKEKRASQEDASCSSSEESAYEEDEAVIASLSKSTKSSTVTKEKENIDDLLPSKRRKTDSVSIKPEEKKGTKDTKNEIPEDQEQQPCLGKLKKLADDILENLPDSAPVYPRKSDEKIPSQKKKNKTEKQKHNKAFKGSEGIRGMQDVDYIPLSTYGATEFGAVPLNKMMRAPKSMAQQAADFRQQMFYGSHIKRISGNASSVYQQKLKAAGKDRLVR